MADRAGQAMQQVYLDLVAGLIDARTDPATARFDDELQQAVAKGTLSPETAHRLRFWQRASVHALADHAKSVVPAALGAIDASRREAAAQVAEMADTLGPDPQQGDAPTPEEPGMGDVGEEEERDAPDARDAGVANETRGEPEVRLPDATGHDTPGPASTTQAPGPSTLEQRRNRLIVADLVTVPTAHPSDDPTIDIRTSP